MDYTARHRKGVSNGQASNDLSAGRECYPAKAREVVPDQPFSTTRYPSSRSNPAIRRPASS